MSKKKITVIDYGCGNIFSLRRILNKLGYEVEISNNPESISQADKIILPGVGAFEIGIKNLRKNNLDESLNLFLSKGNFLMGICLGMQLLMDKSDEFGTHEGLKLISGDVTKLDKSKNFPVPHIGWSKIDTSYSENNNDNFLLNIRNSSFFYFIHSFQVKVKNKKNALSFTEYGENNFCSIVNFENIYGTQFHPEKSGKVGEKLLSNFLSK